MKIVRFLNTHPPDECARSSVHGLGVRGRGLRRETLDVPPVTGSLARASSHNATSAITARRGAHAALQQRSAAERKLSRTSCRSDRAEVRILHAAAHRVAGFLEASLKLECQLIGNQKLRFQTAAELGAGRSLVLTALEQR